MRMVSRCLLTSPYSQVTVPKPLSGHENQSVRIGSWVDRGRVGRLQGRAVCLAYKFALCVRYGDRACI